ncbi:13261_t:CDS:1, partial [Gigaspora rosea]
SISTSSNEILTYIGHILGSNIPIEVSQSNISISASTSLIADVNDLNAAAIYQQEIKEFLESTTKCLQELQNNLIFLQNLIKSKHSSTQEHFNCSDQNTLMSHLHNIVTLDDFGKAQNLVNVISKETGHHRSVASDTSIIPLAKEKKTEAETIIQKLNYMDT